LSNQEYCLTAATMPIAIPRAISRISARSESWRVFGRASRISSATGRFLAKE
jgi:hypothetical protein